MSKKAPLNIQTQLDVNVAMLIEAIDRILISFSSKKHTWVSELLQVNELPDDLSETEPIELCKMAAILGLKVASQVSKQKDAQLSKIAASN